MTGNIALRNSREQEKQTTMAGRNKMLQQSVPPMAYAGYLDMPSACEDRQTYGMRNSCRELVMPIEKHQPHGRLPGRGLLP
jgi:hypothetical protein